MRKLILLLALLVTSLLSCAQISRTDTVIQSFNDIGPALINYYNPQPDSVKNNCWEGCVFIRFNLNQHRCTNIAYTVSTPLFIKEAISQAMFRINERGVNIDQAKNATGRTYILPFMVTNRGGCGFMSGWETDKDKPDEKMKITYERRQQHYEQSANSIWNMTTFSDGKRLEQVNCTLLAPIRMPIPMN